jgi:hypothetical protein
MTEQNEAARAIIANVVRRLLRFQHEEYEAAIDILNKSALSEQAKQIVEAPAVIAALYCGAYDQNDQLRLNRNGRPIGKNFVCNKILQMKPNPYREQTAMLLRELFTDLHRERGDDFPTKTVLLEIFRALRPRVSDEDEPVEQLAA